MIYETAPAKINLTLDTLFKRDDGYHEIAMIMTTVDLNDRLSFQKRKDKKSLLILNITMFQMIIKFGLSCSTIDDGNL